MRGAQQLFEFGTMDIVSLAHSKKEMALWFECDGCVSFHCVNGIGHITNVGSKKEVNDWYLNHFQKYCEHCAGENEYENVVSREKERERIRCKSCKKTQSFFKGLPFDGKRTDPHDWFLAILFFCRGLQQNTICSFTLLADSTVREIIREVLLLISAHNFKVFCDLEETPRSEVQVDETVLCGKRKYETGARRRKDGTVWVAGFISVDKTDKDRMMAHVVGRRDAATLNSFILAATDADSKIVSDGWKAYAQLGETRGHGVVNHKKEFVNDKGEHTNLIECAWRYVKGHIRKRWTTIGTEELVTCNSRVQCGVFFFNCSLDKVNPLQEIFGLIRDHKRLTEYLEIGQKVQEQLFLSEQTEKEAKAAHIEEKAETFYPDPRAPKRPRVEDTEEGGQTQENPTWIVVGSRVSYEGKNGTVQVVMARKASVLIDGAGSLRVPKKMLKPPVREGKAH